MRQKLQQIPIELLDGLLRHSPFLKEVRPPSPTMDSLLLQCCVQTAALACHQTHKAFAAGSRQTVKTTRSSAMSQSRSVVASIDQNIHSPDTSSHSDSDPEFQDIPAGDPDFAPAAREGGSSGPKDSKAKLREKNKRAQKRFRARQKVVMTAYSMQAVPAHAAFGSTTCLSSYRLPVQLGSIRNTPSAKPPSSCTVSCCSPFAFVVLCPAARMMGTAELTCTA